MKAKEIDGIIDIIKYILTHKKEELTPLERNKVNDLFEKLVNKRRDTIQKINE